MKKVVKALISGASSLLVIIPVAGSGIVKGHYGRTDAEAFRSDANKIGNDFKVTIRRYEQKEISSAKTAAARS